MKVILLNEIKNEMPNQQALGIVNEVLKVDMSSVKVTNKNINTLISHQETVMEDLRPKLSRYFDENRKKDESYYRMSKQFKIAEEKRFQIQSRRSDL